MLKLDSFIVTIEKNYRKTKLEEFKNLGFPFEEKSNLFPFNPLTSHLWIGNEFLELSTMTSNFNSYWDSNWISLFNSGHRGALCLMLTTYDIDKFCQNMRDIGVQFKGPEPFKSKWFFNMLTKTYPWRDVYFDFLQGAKLQIGVREIQDDKALDYKNKLMFPNSRENGINGISNVIINAPFIGSDFRLLNRIFQGFIIEKEPLTIQLKSKQTIIFIKDTNFSIDVFTNCTNAKFSNNLLEIENIKIYT